MKFLACFKKYSVCKECGVPFDSVTGYQERWGDLCQTHRAPVMERDEKIDAVVAWARINWEAIYPQYEEETKKASAAQSAFTMGIQNSALNSLRNAMGAMQSNNPYNQGGIL